MPRKPRHELIVPEQPNHIIIRGNNRRRLLSYSTDFRRLLRLLEEANDKHGCKLAATALMSNHVHDVKTPPTVVAASACMKSYEQRYAHYRNAKRGGTGKLFEQRYFSKPVLSMEQLAATIAYVDANPVRGGLVDDPIDYPWCTYALHIGRPDKSGIPARMWTPDPWYRSLGRTASERAAAYHDLFWDYLRRGVEPDHAAEVRAYELLSEEPYTRRLRRPDNSRASESDPDWAFGLKRRVDSDRYDPME